MRIVTWVALALSLFWLAPAQAQQTQQSAPVKIVVLGDNLTYGFQLKENETFSARLEHLARSLGYNATVVNMSAVNARVRDGLNRLDEVYAARPDLVIVELGYNDVMQSTDMNPIVTDLNTLLHRLKQRDISVLLVRVAPPYGTRLVTAQAYDYMYQKLAKNFQTGYYHSLMAGVHGNDALLLPDKFHPNAKGVAVMVDNMFSSSIEPMMRYAVKLREYKQRIK